MAGTHECAALERVFNAALNSSDLTKARLSNIDHVPLVMEINKVREKSAS